MAKISAKTSARLSDGLKRYKSIILSAKAKDINETDTVHLIKDVLADIFGFDKYLEITSELAIKNTYCDLAVKINDQIKLLIEAKAVGIELKDTHVKQAVDYAANKGIDWVVLTTGVIWKIFKISFTKPIDKEEVATFDITALNPKHVDDIEKLFLLSKEGIENSALPAYHEHKRAVNRFVLGAIIQSEPVLKSIRKEVSRLSPEVKIGIEDIASVITQEVFKREVTDAFETKDALKKLQREHTKLEKRKMEKSDKETVSVQPSEISVATA
jgi:hypothetical protein